MPTPVRFSKYFFLLILSVILAGCDIAESCPPVKMSASSTEYLQFVKQILASDENCSPPCWQGLMPGESTYADVLNTLTEIPFVDQKSFNKSVPSQNETGLINWSNTAPQSLSISGQATFAGDAILKAIHFTASYEHPLESLGTVIDTFGEPNVYFVGSSHDFSCKWNRIIWLDEGLEIQTFTQRAEEDGPHLSGNTAVRSVVYFIPQETLEEYLRNGYGISESNYRKWNGFP